MGGIDSSINVSDAGAIFWIKTVAKKDATSIPKQIGPASSDIT